jgi:hypothetical protein
MLENAGDARVPAEIRHVVEAPEPVDGQVPRVLQDHEKLRQLIPQILVHRLVEETLARAHLRGVPVAERQGAPELIQVHRTQDPELGKSRGRLGAGIIDQRKGGGDVVGHDVHALTGATLTNHRKQPLHLLLLRVAHPVERRRDVAGARDDDDGRERADGDHPVDPMHPAQWRLAGPPDQHSEHDGREGGSGIEVVTEALSLGRAAARPASVARAKIAEAPAWRPSARVASRA